MLKLYNYLLLQNVLLFSAFNDQYDTSHLFLSWGVKIWARYWNKVPDVCHWFLIPAFQKPFLVINFPCKIWGFDQLLSAPGKALNISRRKWNIIAVKHLLFKGFSDCFDVIWFLFLFFFFCILVWSFHQILNHAVLKRFNADDSLWSCQNGVIHYGI